MNELILKALGQAIKEYPEIIPYLTGNAAKIATDGVEWHLPFEPATGDVGGVEESDWEITQADIDAAVARWDELMPEYQGLLDAEVDNA